MATSAAVEAFRAAWREPTEEQLVTFGSRRNYLLQLWATYENRQFDDPRVWAEYKRRYQLYRAIRPIYNPTRRLVDFYAGAVYPGVLSTDGRELPDGVPLAVPLAEDTDPDLADAIAQAWQWGNWQAEKSVFVRYGAACGSVLVEVIDDMERQKVYQSVVAPWQIARIELDGTGNVRAYAIEYAAIETDGRRYTYRREVDRQSFRTFRDGRPHAYGDEGAEWANPYGFCPAVWARHSHTGGDWGAPAMAGSLGKVDEVNSLAAHVHDQVHKRIAGPSIIFGSGNIQSLTASKRAASDELENPYADREETLIWKGPPGGTVSSLAGDQTVADAWPAIDRLLRELEDDKPELVVSKQLREMSQVTGPGAARLISDASARLFEAQANYDQQLVKLHGMLVAIGGWRAAGGWTRPLSSQQEKFLPFDLTSYARGELDHTIMPRPLVQKTEAERLTELSTEAAAAQAWVTAGMPLEVFLRRERGWSAPELAQLGADRLASIQREQALAQEDTTPVEAQ